VPKAAGNEPTGNKPAAGRPSGKKAAGNSAAARAKVAQMRAEEAQRRRRQLLVGWIGAGVIAVVAVIAIVVAVVSGGGGSAAAGGGGGHPSLKLAPLSSLGTLQPAPAAGPAGPEGVPIPAAAALAGTSTVATGHPVDGISCQTSEQTLFHIHAHLTVFVNGSPRQVPAGIGIPGAQSQQTPQGTFITGGNCLYWLHTHAADGIIHIESPVHRTFTLGDVFSIWGQPLSSHQVGPASGTVTALYNGQVYRGNPQDIPLNAHAQIQLEVGRPLVAPEHLSNWHGL
jgi:hypothetical protein